MGILAYVIIGFVVGLLSRAALPSQRHMGFWATVLAGIAGGVLGGVVVSVAMPREPMAATNPVGLGAAVLGAIALIGVLVLALRRSPFQA